jgi:hypothetical protein
LSDVVLRGFQQAWTHCATALLQIDRERAHKTRIARRLSRVSCWRQRFVPCCFRQLRQKNAQFLQNAKLPAGGKTALRFLEQRPNMG